MLSALNDFSIDRIIEIINEIYKWQNMEAHSSKR